MNEPINEMSDKDNHSKLVFESCKDIKTGQPYKNLAGAKFGYLTALERVGTNKHGSVLWKCRCDCGNTKIYPSGKLVDGRATNCGCMTVEIRRKKASKHGITAGGKPRTFVIWNGMKLRCLNPKATSYPNYGARGITICDEWMSFENFHNWAINNGYGDDKEIDRIDNDGNYCPENCRWVDRKFNRLHQRRIRNIEISGEILSINAWCKKVGISKTIAYKYLHKSEEAFISFVKEKLREQEETACT